MNNKLKYVNNINNKLKYVNNINNKLKESKYYK